MISSPGSADQDALLIAENFLCIKSEILGKGRSGFYPKNYLTPKMNNAFQSRLLVYGYINSNPEISSVPIQSHFLSL
jgi:hypothetical protein